MSPVDVTPRIRRLRQELFATQTRPCFARAAIVTRSYLATEGEPWVIRRARALAAVFEEMPLLLRPGELIVGQRAAILAGRSVYPEYNLDGLTPETTPAEIWDAWQGKTLRDEVYTLFPEPLRKAERELACAYATGSASGFGHLIVDYEKGHGPRHQRWPSWQGTRQQTLVPGSRSSMESSLPALCAR